MDLGLNGKIALVTGGSEGIGFAAAKELASEGAKVIICARREDVLADAANAIKSDAGTEVSTICCDITNPSEVDNMFQKIVDTGGLDILVNNAGTSSAGLFHETSDETWKYDIELKVFGAIRCSRHAVPIMKKRGGGRIVNITTPGGKAPTAASVPTSVSRAAGIALTKEMSKDYASDNILVNTVCVGLIKSGQHETRWRNSIQAEPSLTLDSFYQSMGSGVPMGRVGEAREVAGLIAFLVSERGSYITGTAINVDGGSSPVV